MNGPRRKASLVSLESDLQQLEKALDEIGNVLLLVIDPLSAYLGSRDSHKDSEIRRVRSRTLKTSSWNVKTSSWNAGYSLARLSICRLPAMASQRQQSVVFLALCNDAGRADCDSGFLDLIR
jgi:hypothetical protein